MSSSVTVPLDEAKTGDRVANPGFVRLTPQQYERMEETETTVVYHGVHENGVSVRRSEMPKYGTVDVNGNVLVRHNGITTVYRGNGPPVGRRKTANYF
jgi:hypothetical protein